MSIRIATTDTEISACYPLMRALRPHIAEHNFLARIRSQEATGYRLVLSGPSDNPLALAGFRIGENLAWDRFLYVDDLVVHPNYRSQGHGAKLMAWLRKHAAGHNCSQVHLDSGMQRADAHQFYECEGMVKAGFHFIETVALNEGADTLIGRNSFP
jgi:GNAT superfamily N-acetyltransferase